MIKFILCVIGLFLIVSYPPLILIGGVVWLTWLYCSKKETLRPKQEPIITPPPAEDKGFTTTEERLAESNEEIRKRAKCNPMDDPETAEKIRETRRELERRRKKADREMKLDILREAEKAAAEGDWNKVDKLEQEIEDLRLNS